MVESYQAQLHQVGWSLCTVSVLVVVGRCYCRLVVLKRFGWDDAFMVFAMLSGATCAALVSAGVHYGFGLHLADITDDYSREEALKFTFIAPAISIVSSTAGKISMVFFLIRLLGHSATAIHKWILFSVTFIMIGLNFFIIGILLGNCQPMERTWKPQTPGTCLPPGYLDYGGRLQASWNAFMDLVTAGFPAYMVWRLQIKHSTKWGLTFLMGGGVFAAAATLVKVWYMCDLTKLTDVTYAWGPIAIWYMAEIYVLIIAGTIPTLKPLLSKIRGRLSSISSYARSGGNSWKYPYGSSTGPSNNHSSEASKTSRGFGSKGRPGSVTIALNEIDGITHRGAGSSLESILPRSGDGLATTTTTTATAPSNVSVEAIERSGTVSPEIRVERNFSIKYHEVQDSSHNVVANHYPFP